MQVEAGHSGLRVSESGVSRSAFLGKPALTLGSSSTSFSVRRSSSVFVQPPACNSYPTYDYNEKEASEVLLNLINYMSIKNVLATLQKDDEAQHDKFYSFAKGRSLKDTRNFVLDLMNFSPDLGLQLLNEQEKVANRLEYNVLPDLVERGLYGAKMDVLRSNLFETCAGVEQPKTSEEPQVVDKKQKKEGTN